MTTTEPIDTTALRETAEAATPGPWEAEYDPDEGGVTVSAGSARTIGGKHAWSYVSTDRILEWDDVWPEEGGEQREADAAHIAAFHPGTALALLGEVDALRAQVDRLHTWDGLMHLLDEHWPESMMPTLSDDVSRDPGPRIVSLLRWVEALRAQVEQIKARREEVGEETEGWWIGGAWGDYGEPVVPLRIMSYVIDGELDQKVATSDPGFALTFAEQVARAERAEAEAAALRAQVERVREVLFASDDGTEYEHDRDHGQAEGYPECPGCWVETIRRALDGEVEA